MEAKKQRPEQEYLELKKAYEKNRIMMGEDHPDTHACLDRLAEYYDRIGDYDEAIELEEELLSKRNALYGQDSEVSGDTYLRLASFYAHRREYPKIGRAHV